jgi:hypothetical protein
MGVTVGASYDAALARSASNTHKRRMASSWFEMAVKR